MSDQVGAGAPAAGWYADPTGAPIARWWSGAGWTEHTRELPRPQVAPPPVPSPPVPSPPAPAAEDPTPAPYVPFESRRAAVEAAAYAPASAPRNRHAFLGRGLSILAVIVSILTVIVLDIALHIPQSDWAVYSAKAGLILAPGLAISGIVFSSIGLGKMRSRGSGGVATAGLVLGILFTFAPFWVGLAIGIIVAVGSHA
ncbi:DUF2510 domain-containing protein [Leifsonia sp. AG29]|uniref:DUF2510 domain-containing protein n=1 Tax=Leifsonia sp. AG29 TaxID=2598860 RepID=UPI00131B00DB|nr:DUF2510 domain-containing protein [Leifsonia sp. AG29]